MKKIKINSFIFISIFLILSCKKKESSEKIGINIEQTAPEIELEAIFNKEDNKIPTLSSLKNEIIILDFWATWCAPCIASFPEHDKLQKKYKDKGVQFIAITDDSKEKLNNFLGNTSFMF